MKIDEQMKLDLRGKSRNQKNLIRKSYKTYSKEERLSKIAALEDAELFPSQEHIECTFIFRVIFPKKQLRANGTASPWKKKKIPWERDYIENHKRSLGAEEILQD